MHSQTEIPVEIFDKARSEGAHIYMWGWTDYDDVFQRTKRHRTEFCLEIIVRGDVRTETCQFSFAQQGGTTAPMNSAYANLGPIFAVNATNF